MVLGGTPFDTDHELRGILYALTQLISEAMRRSQQPLLSSGVGCFELDRQLERNAVSDVFDDHGVSLRGLTLELSGRCRVPHDSTEDRRSGPLERIVRPTDRLE